MKFLHSVGSALFVIALLNSGCSVKSAIFGNSVNAQQVASTQPLSTTNFSQRLMGRTFVSTTLNDIFGPSVDSTTGMYIAPVAYDFILGGPCDNYGGDCPDSMSADSQAPIIAGTVASREAMMTRTCDFIASTDSAIRYAAAQARNESLAQNFASATDANLAPPNMMELAEAYDLFFPGKTADPNVTSSLQLLSLQVMNSGPNMALESWRFVFLTLCLAPDWQIP